MNFIELKTKCLELDTRNPYLNLRFDMHAEEYFAWKNEIPSETINNSQIFIESEPFNRYLFSLLEEIHRIAYQIGFEISLYVHQLENQDDILFFSARFFLNNAVWNTMSAWERVAKIFGMMFGINFDSNPRRNTFEHLYRKLKKTEFRNTEMFSIISELRSSDAMNLVSSIRRTNDHDLSAHINVQTDQEMKETAVKCFENASTLYSIVPLTLDMFETRFFIPRFSGIPVPDMNLLQTHDFKKMENKLSSVLPNGKFTKQVQKIDFNVRRLVSSVVQLDHFLNVKSNQQIERKQLLRVTDAIFRLHEAIRSLSYACDLFSKGVRYGYKDIDEVNLLGIKDLNYRYFIHSATTRVYSCYDKLAHISLDILGMSISSHVMFENTLQELKRADKLVHNPIVQEMERLSKTNNYKELNRIRQDVYHYIIVQNFISVREKEVLDFYIATITSKNIELLCQAFRIVIRHYSNILYATK